MVPPGNSISNHPIQTHTMKKLKKCPACGRQIYQYAQVCPYCKAETHFTSIDEERPPVIEEEVKSVEELENTAVEQEPENDSKAAHGRLGEYVKILKEDTEKVRQEYDEKIGKRYSKSTILIGTVIAILSLIVLSIFIAVQTMEKKTFSIATSVDNELKAVIDSMEAELYQSSTIVAKFPDRQRHSMVYLQDGHLFIFDAVSQKSEELNLQEINPKAVVDYNGSGVLNAYLSTNEKYILIIASRNAGNTEFGFYRLNAQPEKHELEVIDRGRVVPDKDGYKVSTDSRTASYDSNGDKVSGLSSTEWEQVAPKIDKPKKTQEKTEERKVNTEEHVSVTEQIKPTVDIAPKPTVPVAPEKINIKPVKTNE